MFSNAKTKLLLFKKMCVTWLVITLGYPKERDRLLVLISGFVTCSTHEKYEGWREVRVYSVCVIVSVGLCVERTALTDKLAHDSRSNSSVS